MNTKFTSRATRKAKGVMIKGGTIRRVEVTMEEELFKKLHDYAMSQGRSLSGQARYIIDQFFNKN